jgi:outer membrane protein TolC
MKSVISFRLSPMTSRNVVLFALALVVPLTLRAGEVDSTPEDPEKQLRLDWVLGEVRTNNASLKAAQLNWEARLARVEQARSLQHPGKPSAEDASNPAGAGGNDVENSVERLRISFAEAEAEAARADWRRRELDLIAGAHAAFFRYASAIVQLDLNRKNERLLAECLQATRQQYALGVRTQADLLSVEIDLARVLELRADLAREIADEQSQLNVLMNRPAYRELPPPAPASFKRVVLSRFQPPPSIHSEGDENQFNFDWTLFEQRMQLVALSHRPELHRALVKTEAARTRLELARLGWYTGLTLRVESVLNDDLRLFDGFAPGLSGNVNRAGAKALIDEAAKTLQAAESELAALRIETTGLIRKQVGKIETSQAHYLFVRDRALPLARQRFETMQNSYLAGRAHFLDFLYAERALWETESRLERHLADYLSAIAEMEALVGAKVETEEE